VLVAGAGAGGMTAALVAALEGLEVLLCEKSKEVGGTTATSAGTVWIPRDADAARAYLDSLTGSGSRAGELREAYLRFAPEAIDYLAAKSEVQFVSAGRHPDYRETRGAAVEGRAWAAMPFDGRLLGPDFRRVRAPMAEFMVLGGMMVSKADIAPLVGRFSSTANFLHAARLVTRYVADRVTYPRGTRLVMGNALVARLLYSLRRHSVTIAFQAPLVELITDDGAVIGARVGNLRVKARRAVVLATGGYGHNPALRAAYLPASTPSYSLSCAENQGDGMTVARSVGAAVAAGRFGGGLWTPVSRTRRADGSEGLFPHIILDRAKPGLIAVNSAGRRFVNEGCSYHDFVDAMFESHKQVPTIPAYLICDSEFVARYGLGTIHPGSRLQRHEKTGTIVCAGTLAELARKLQMEPPALEETVNRHNEFARLGEDRDFGKGSTVLNRFNGDPSRPHPCLGPIRQAPFCAMPVWPADLAVSTGLMTDDHARVLDEHSQPIPGLYACGNDMASIFEGTYPGPGTTLGPALTFGYRAAVHAARRHPHNLRPQLS
jgi:succinate dehydrogenase/fumarate reductase flavoprotein subunit